VMYIVDSREFRPRLPRYLRQAKEGNEVVVVVHGRPAALLRAVRPDDDGPIVASRFLRDELHLAIQRARAGCLVVTWYGRAYALLEAPTEGSKVMEVAS
jgi:prevent-host-death family protein